MSLIGGLIIGVVAGFAVGLGIYAGLSKTDFSGASNIAWAVGLFTCYVVRRIFWNALKTK